ncbi:hypothetical protein [Leucobacter sp. NPDC077196]|uniref:hypothetical protein n=1 Tax=Leucobacter sp. NPDC077196 TaxID=3154959 RepID=UPI0034260566
MPLLDLEERASGRGVFDTQPRVLCGNCNSAWMTPFEDIAGPLLAGMISSSGPRSVDNEEAQAVAMWAVAALMIRSTVDPAIPRLSPERMRVFRAEGWEAIEASVAVFSIANTRAFFSGDAVGSTYISDAYEPEASALCLLFFQQIVVIVGVGKFSCLVQRAASVFAGSAALVWLSSSAEQQGWPTRSQVVDSDLLLMLGVEHHSRSMFVPATRVRGSNASRRTVVRVPEAFTLNEITTDQQLLTSMRALEEIIAKGLAERYRS